MTNLSFCFLNQGFYCFLFSFWRSNDALLRMWKKNEKFTWVNYQAIHRVADVCLDNKTVNFTSDRAPQNRNSHCDNNKRRLIPFNQRNRPIWIFPFASAPPSTVMLKWAPVDAAPYINASLRLSGSIWFPPLTSPLPHLPASLHGH